MALGVASIVVLFLAFNLIKVLIFTGDSTGKARTDDFVTPTINALATGTAGAREAELFGTPGPSNINPSPQIIPTTTPTRAAATNSKLLERIKNGERINMLFMGFGGEGHEGAYLTDTMLVISYDSKSKTVTQFNIPRDLWVFASSGPNGAGFWGKINGVFSTIMEWTEPTQDKLDLRYHWKDQDNTSKLVSAANLAADTVQKVIGIRIDHWVTMNFDGFRKLIDAMGGVDINVERAFIDNEYPRNDNADIDASVMTVKFDAGVQHMNGERAIQFSRSRKSKGLEEGDPARSRRQMKVIQAIKEKALKQNLAFDLLKYLDALSGNIRTTLTVEELTSLASFVNSDEGKSLGDSSKFDSEIMNGNNVLQVIDQPEYRLLPKEGQGKYTQLQQWIQNAFIYTGLRREGVTAQVLNASGVAGLAGKWADYMLEHGFRMAESENAPTLDNSVVFDYTNGVATAHIKQIQKYFPGIKLVSQTGDKKPYPGAPDFLVYLGKDYKSISSAAATGG